MRSLALALAFCFMVAPMEAATSRGSLSKTVAHPVKVKKAKKAPKERRAKRPVKHSA